MSEEGGMPPECGTPPQLEESTSCGGRVHFRIHFHFCTGHFRFPFTFHLPLSASQPAINPFINCFTAEILQRFLKDS